ncbi:hypothetical protein DFJ74DRAFT_678662 [Hyaloraphidium curvatum]|nr:hypothetical protein DFJ74DRAFT_678662 [Hyaloraphidium curvatum]
MPLQRERSYRVCWTSQRWTRGRRAALLAAARPTMGPGDGSDSGETVEPLFGGFDGGQGGREDDAEAAGGRRPLGWAFWTSLVLALLTVPMAVSLLVLVVLNYDAASAPPAAPGVAPAAASPPPATSSEHPTHTLPNAGEPGKIIELPVNWTGDAGVAHLLYYNTSFAPVMGLPPAPWNPRVFRFGDPRKPLGFPDAGLTCRVFSLPDEPLQLVAAQPLVDLHGGVELVHHIDIYACNDLIDQLPEDSYAPHSRCPMVDQFDRRGPCWNLMFAYDRGAHGFVFPNSTGFPVGKGTPITRLALELHYLAPENWPSNPLAVTGACDVSGFRLDLVRRSLLRPVTLGSTAFVATEFNVPPSRGLWQLRADYSPAQLWSRLASDFRAAPNRTLTLVAAHLHTHNYSVASYLEQYRGGRLHRRIRTHGRGGYGAVQSFERMPPVRLKKGDGLSYTCIYDTSGLREALGPHPAAGDKARTGVGYSLNAGGEMCAPLMLYAPSLGGKPVLGTNYDSTVGFSGPFRGKLEDLERADWEERAARDRGDWAREAGWLD